jgi:hypothetical protein
MKMQILAIVVFGAVGAVVPVVVFVAAKAKPVDVVLAALGYGGTIATAASMGTFYKQGPYLYVPIASLCTAAWMLATVRLVHYRGPVRWRWQPKPEDHDEMEKTG